MAKDLKKVSQGPVAESFCSWFSSKREDDPIWINAGDNPTKSSSWLQDQEHLGPGVWVGLPKQTWVNLFFGMRKEHPALVTRDVAACLFMLCTKEALQQVMESSVVNHWRPETKALLKACVAKHVTALQPIRNPAAPHAAPPVAPPAAQERVDNQSTTTQPTGQQSTTTTTMPTTTMPATTTRPTTTMQPKNHQGGPQPGGPTKVSQPPAQQPPLPILISSAPWDGIAEEQDEEMQFQAATRMSLEETQLQPQPMPQGPPTANPFSQGEKLVPMAVDRNVPEAASMSPKTTVPPPVVAAPAPVQSTTSTTAPKPAPAHPTTTRTSARDVHKTFGCKPKMVEGMPGLASQMANLAASSTGGWMNPSTTWGPPTSNDEEEAVSGDAMQQPPRSKTECLAKYSVGTTISIDMVPPFKVDRSGAARHFVSDTLGDLPRTDLSLVKSELDLNSAKGKSQSEFMNGMPWELLLTQASFRDVSEVMRLWCRGDRISRNMAMLFGRRWHQSRSRYLTLRKPKDQKQKTFDMNDEVPVKQSLLLTVEAVPSCLFCPPSRIAGKQQLLAQMPNSDCCWLNFPLATPSGKVYDLDVSRAQQMTISVEQVHSDGIFRVKKKVPIPLLDAIIQEMVQGVEFDVRQGTNEHIYDQDGIQYAVRAKMQGDVFDLDGLRSAQGLDQTKPVLVTSQAQGRVVFCGPFVRNNTTRHGKWGYAPFSPACKALLVWLVDEGLVPANQIHLVNILLRYQSKDQGTQQHVDKAAYGRLVYQMSRTQTPSAHQTGMVFCLPPFPRIPLLSRNDNSWSDYYWFVETLQCPTLFVRDAEDHVLGFTGKARDVWCHGVPNVEMDRLSITIRPRTRWTCTSGLAPDPHALE